MIEINQRRAMAAAALLAAAALMTSGLCIIAVEGPHLPHAISRAHDGADGGPALNATSGPSR